MLYNYVDLYMNIYSRSTGRYLIKYQKLCDLYKIMCFPIIHQFLFISYLNCKEEVGDDEEFDEGSQNSADVQLPKLTLKLGSQAIQDSYNQDPLDLDSSFNTTEDVSMVEEAVVPKL